MSLKIENLIWEYDIDNLTAADYNPRKITDNAFERLKESLSLFGVVKPVIVNRNGITVAGHQRTRAMKAVGIKKCPVFLLKLQVKLQDEIKFNLMHNSVETDSTKVNIKNPDSLELGYNIVSPDKIENIKSGTASITKEICNLLNRYGDYGSVIINSDGEIIHNADYAFCCKLLNRNLLVYKMDNETAATFAGYIAEDYGSYCYDALNIKSYVQTHCQMNRNGESISSTLYDNYVIPNLKKTQRAVDFGAGKMFYCNSLRAKGYYIMGYEPFFKNPRVHKEVFDISAIVKHIKAIQKDVESNGLFDVVILDSVINSVVSDDFQDKVLTTCNSLLSADGTFYMSTRNMAMIENQASLKTSKDNCRYLQFLDANNYTATFRKGVWTMQKFHTKESLEEVLKKYFYEVKVVDKKESNLWAICRKPKPLADYETALNVEFNMEYPQGYKHNKHEAIVSTILENVTKRDKENE